MATIPAGSAGRFEDLIAWQKARLLTREVYRITQCREFKADKALAVQMQRAAVSVMSNIAEGFERNNHGDFRRFLVIAKASCGEVRSQLYVARDVDLITDEEFRQISHRATEVSRIIGGLINSVEAQQRQ